MFYYNLKNKYYICLSLNETNQYLNKKHNLKKLQHRKNIQDILKSFCPISLQRTNTIRMNNRIDTKYLFHISKLPSILSAVRDYYSILTINEKRVAFYKTLYFDTPNFYSYIIHHNGRLNRFKVRIRHYTDSNTFFLEKKFKTNKGYTGKKRLKISGIENEFSREEKRFIYQYTSFDPNTLSPTLLNSFQRITLVQPKGNERVTIDFNLQFSTMNGHNIQFNNIVIAEIKKDKIRKYSKITEIFRHNGIHTSGFSKYCIGIACLYDNIKYNRFKFRLLQIKKIENGGF